MREVVGRSQFENILTQDRESIQIQVRELMQKTLDLYGAGVTITNVTMQKVDPPGEVIDAYRDVQAARATRSGRATRRKASPTRSSRRPAATRPASSRTPRPYRQQAIAEASGQAKRFLSVLAQYRGAPDVTRRRIYIETMSGVLGNMNKVIVDNSARGVVPYFQLPNAAGGIPVQPPAAAATGGASQ
ncbi:MAG: SPFH domain-containing protein [Rhizomicrobium sp.]